MSRRVAMGIVGLDHVQVASPRGCETEARRFYGTLLGLEEIDKPPELRARGGVWFRCGNQQLHIGVEDGFAPAQKAHPALRVADDGELDVLAKRLRQADECVIWDEALPDIRRFYTQDPWGNRIELLSESHGLVDLVETVRRLPYGRPGDRTAEGMFREQCGTCSTKHLFLAKALTERFPETDPLIVHRVYTLDRDRARELFGAEIAEIVPEHGLVDVHRYITIALEDQRIEIDATFPGPAWDGHSALPLACGPGQDYPAGEEPDAEKRTLEERYCDPAVREPFIAALARRRC